jgi:hypothetical protein
LTSRADIAAPDLRTGTIQQFLVHGRGPRAIGLNPMAMIAPQMPQMIGRWSCNTPATVRL